MRYLGPGSEPANCCSETLGVPFYIDPRAWHLFLEPCALAAADAVAWLDLTAEGYPRPFRDPEAVAHVAPIVARGDTLDACVVAGKLTRYLGRYEFAVAEAEDIPVAPEDLRALFGEEADAPDAPPYAVHLLLPFPVRRTGRRPQHDGWYTHPRIVDVETEDLPGLDPDHYGHTPEGDVRWRVTPWAEDALAAIGADLTRRIHRLQERAAEREGGRDA